MPVELAGRGECRQAAVGVGADRRGLGLIRAPPARRRLDALADAALCARRPDWLVGMKRPGAITVRSAGAARSLSMRPVHIRRWRCRRRELAIKSFVPGRTRGHRHLHHRRAGGLPAHLTIDKKTRISRRGRAPRRGTGAAGPARVASVENKVWRAAAAALHSPLCKDGTSATASRRGGPRLCPAPTRSTSSSRNRARSRPLPKASR